MIWHSVSQLGQHRRETREGYIAFHDVVIARTGTQVYHEHEIPPLVGDSGGRVHVAREPEDVFDEDSIRSFDGKPIVDDHPSEMVGPDNWSDLAIGYLANPRRGKRPNDDVLLADLIFTTRKGIAAVTRGKRAVSVGYTAEYDQDSPGTGRQRAIFCNHLALVDEGRCGSRCVILDGKPIWSEDTLPSPPPTGQTRKTLRQWLGLKIFAGDTMVIAKRFRERVTVRDEFNEADHPRDEDGKFTLAGGGGAGGGGGAQAKTTQTFSKSQPPPHEMHGVPFHHWAGHATNAAWEHEAKQGEHFDEPEFKPTPGKKTGAGVIIQEPDGRVWIVHPTNEFGGYKATFPKGGVEAGMTQKGTALKEAFEESGLKVELTGFAGDVERSTSKARYYYAKRVGGTPAAHGWESSGVTLAPVEDLKAHLNHPVDHEMVDTLLTGLEGKQSPTPTPFAQQANEAGQAPPSVATWKKVGGQKGSNPAAQMEDETGAKHYVKFQKSDEHARNEVLASRLYAAAGAEALQPKLVDVGDGKLGTATRWAENVKLIDHNSASERAAAQENFATHAWLANWDAPGLTYDNQGVINGQMHTLDVGGSLLFRAQGGPKGAAFGYEAGEWDTLRMPNNTQAHKLFGEMTDEQLKDSAKRVAIIPDETIKALVMEHGPGDQIAKAALANKLIARKQDIMARAGITEPEAEPALSAKAPPPPPEPAHLAPPPAEPLAPNEPVPEGVPLAKASHVANSTAAQAIMAQVKAHIAEGGDPTPTVKAVKAYAAAKVNSDYARHANAILAHLEQHHGLAKGELGKAMAKGATAPPPEPKAKAAPAPEPTPTPAPAPIETPPEPPAPELTAKEKWAAGLGPDPSVMPLPEPGTAQEFHHSYAVNHEDDPATKAAYLKSEAEHSSYPANKAYAEALAAHMEHKAATETAAAPATAHDPSVMPEPAADNPAQEWLHQYTSDPETSTSEKLGIAHNEAANSHNPDNEAYAHAVIAHLEHKQAAETAATPEPTATPAASPGELPKPIEGFASQEKLHKIISNHPGTTAEKLATVEKAMGNYISEANKNYGHQMITHLKEQMAAEGGAPTPEPQAAAPGGLPEPNDTTSLTQTALKEDIEKHTGTTAEKIAYLEAEKGAMQYEPNKAYAEKLISHLQAQQTSEPEPAASPEPDHLQTLFSGKPDITAHLPGYEPGNPVHSYLQSVMHDPNLADHEKVAKAQTEYALSKAPENKAYAKAMVEHFGGEITPDDEAYAQHIQSLSEPAATEPNHSLMPEPEAGNVAQEQLHHAILNHPGTKAEKIAEAAQAHNVYAGQGNKDYAKALIAHLKTLPDTPATAPEPTPATVPPSPGTPPVTPEPATTGHTFHAPEGLPPKPYGYKAANIHAAATHEGSSLAEKIKAVQAISGEGINNYKQGVIKALKAANTPLPKPGTGKKAQAQLHKHVQNETTLQGKLGVIETNAGHWTMPANIAYKEALAEAVHKQHSATPGGPATTTQASPAATPAATPAPAPKPAPPPGPVAGPDPAPNSNKQKEIHEIANHPTDTHEVKAAKITAIGNVANPGGTTQTYANTYLKALGAPEVSPPAPTPYTPTPQVSGTPNAPKPSTTHAVSPNKMKTARAQKLHAGAAKISSGEDPKAKLALPSMDRNWWSKIPAASRAAVKSYKGGSSAINGQLRGDSGSWSQHTQHEIDHLDELFEHPENVLQQDTILRRGEGVDQKVIDKHMADLAKGAIVRPHRTGFTSTSMASKAAFGSKNVIYEIIAKKGTQAVGMWANDPSFHSENEVLLRHGTSLEVYEIEKVGNQYIYRCHTL